MDEYRESWSIYKTYTIFSQLITAIQNIHE
jgi:hypothetical protein